MTVRLALLDQAVENDLDHVLAALDLRPGRGVVLLQRNAKVPISADGTWAITREHDQIAQHLADGGNIGLRGGAAADLVIHDVDNGLAYADLGARLGPLAGATVDSTLGYARGVRGVLMAAMPMLEMVDMLDHGRHGSSERPLVQERARRRRVPARRLARPADRVQPGPAHATRRQQGGRVAYRRRRLSRPQLSRLAPGLPLRLSSRMVRAGRDVPTLSLALTVWVGGIVTQELIEGLTPHFPRPVNGRSPRTSPSGSCGRRLPDLLAPGDAWRLARPLALARRGRFEAATDRVTRLG
jgi:hypothetical protein